MCEKWLSIQQTNASNYRAAGTAPAGQAKTGPLVDRTTLVMVVNIKKLPTCSTVNIGGCGYKVGVVSKNFPRAYSA